MQVERDFHGNSFGNGNEMKKYLEFNNLLNEESENIKNNIFYITDDENKFKKNLLDFIKIDSPNIKKIYLK